MDKNLKQYKILLVGGNGFIGKRLTAALSVIHTVSVFDMKPPEQELKGVAYITDSIQNSEKYKEVLCEQDILIHVFSASIPNQGNPIHDCENDVIGTLKLLQCLKPGTIKKFIFLSSGGAIYGLKQSIITESDELNPISSYGITKAVIEKYIALYARTCGFQYLFLRPGNIYGPGIYKIKNQNVISNFLLKIYNNISIEIWGDGSSIKDYIYIDDFVELLLIVIEKDLCGIYNVGTGIGYSVKHVLEIISDTVQRNFTINYVPSKTTDVSHVILDSSKLQTALAWHAKTSLEQGITDVWNDILKHTCIK